jgi:hypothetical protein
VPSEVVVVAAVGPCSSSTVGVCVAADLVLVRSAAVHSRVSAPA